MFGSSGRAAGNAGSAGPAAAWAALAALALGPSFALCQDAGETAPTGGLDHSFLLLPPYEIVWNGEAPAKITVGDRLNLKLMGLPDGRNAGNTGLRNAPGSEGLLAQGWFLLWPKGKEVEAGPGEIPFTAVPLQRGRISIPSLGIEDSGGQLFGRTNPFPLEVAPPQGEGQASDYLPPVGLGFPWWAVIAMALAAIALLGTFAWFLRRYLNRDRQAMPLPEVAAAPKPEDEEALAALAELERRMLWKTGDFKRHYFAVSEILKVYLGRRYGFDARESTSSELLEALERMGVGDRTLDKIEGLFQGLDLVKFTDRVPSDQESSAVLSSGRGLVSETRRPPPVVASVPPGGAGQEAGRAL